MEEESEYHFLLREVVEGELRAKQFAILSRFPVYGNFVLGSPGTLRISSSPSPLASIQHLRER